MMAAMATVLTKGLNKIMLTKPPKQDLPTGQCPINVTRR